MDPATRQRSKAAERRVARKLGGERVPLSGPASKHTSGDVMDVEPPLYVEVKSRKECPVHENISDLNSKARRRDRSPLLHYQIQDDNGDVYPEWVAIWLEDYIELRPEIEEMTFDQEAFVEPFSDRWLREHIVRSRHRYASLVVDTVEKSIKEDMPPLVVLCKKNSPNIVAMVPIK